MPAYLSIIIPTLNAGDTLAETLDHLLPGIAYGIIREVIVSDGGSDDETRTLAEDAGATVLQSATGRGAQLKAGAENAKGDWLLFLHADTHLPADWVGAVDTHVARSDNAAVFRLSFRSEAMMAGVTAGWANLRTCVFGLPYGDQGLLISRALYDTIGGYSAQPLMEDVAIAKALKGKIDVLATTASTDAAKYENGGWIRRGARNLVTLLRYLCGADTKILARSYHKR